MSSQNTPKTIEERIASKTDLAIAHGTEVSSQVGGITFKDMGQVMEFSKLMAVAGQAVPKHLRGQPGACMAVVTQSLNWRMDPFAVANKSYMVNDRIAYEAQLVHAVIEQRAPIKGRLKGRYEGEGEKRICILTAIDAESGDTVEYRSPEIGTITVKNSPLWKSDPDQQLWYYSARAMCRRHFPDVLLGVYSKDEIEDSRPMRNVSDEPHKKGGFADMAVRARGEIHDEPNQTEDEQPEEVEDAEVIPEDEDDEQPEEVSADPFSDEYQQGINGFKAGAPVTLDPYAEGKGQAEPQKSADWIAGWHRAKMNSQEDSDNAQDDAG